MTTWRDGDVYYQGITNRCGGKAYKINPRIEYQGTIEQTEKNVRILNRLS